MAVNRRQVLIGARSICKISNIERGHVFWADVPYEHVVEQEQANSANGSPRPWLVVQSMAIGGTTSVAVPLTTTAPSDPFRHVTIRLAAELWTRIPSVGTSLADGLTQYAIVYQMRALAHARLKNDPIAKLRGEGMAAVEAAMRHVLQMP